MPWHAPCPLWHAMLASQPRSAPVYRPRKPHRTPFYQCAQDFWELLEDVWEERFRKRFGFLRRHLKQVMVNFLNCGDLHAGFARIRCDACGNEYLLAHSCKLRHFCPSCHQKRTVEFAEWICGHVLKAVPHRHLTFSLPKILRPYFLYDRRLLADLSRCAWQSIRTFLAAAGASRPGAQRVAAIVATQTFGADPTRFHPHLHILVPDGQFTDDGAFVLAPRFHARKLTEIFRHKVLKKLLAKGKITRERIRLMDSWAHSGFHVHCGPSILPDDHTAMENLAAYIVRASFSPKRMKYCAEQGKVLYRSKDAREHKTYDALEWLAAMVSHLPLKGEQLVKYYGHYSNRARGERRKKGQDPATPPPLLDPDLSSKEARRTWSHLIRKIYEKEVADWAYPSSYADEGSSDAAASSITGNRGRGPGGGAWGRADRGVAGSVDDEDSQGVDRCRRRHGSIAIAVADCRYGGWVARACRSRPSPSAPRRTALRLRAWYPGTAG